MDRPAWEGYAEAEKYDTTFDNSLQIPYEEETALLENLCKDILTMLEINYDLYYKEQYDKESFVTEVNAYLFNNFAEEDE